MFFDSVFGNFSDEIQPYSVWSESITGINRFAQKFPRNFLALPYNTIFPAGMWVASFTGKNTQASEVYRHRQTAQHPCYIG